jgi:CCR4-NOT transcription complex subunit 10
MTILIQLHQDPTSLFLKASYEFARGNYRKATKLLNSVGSVPHTPHGPNIEVMYYNNLGCINLQVLPPMVY